MSAHATRIEEAVVPPAVGLNWLRLAQFLDVDLGHVQHEGAIVVSGEFYPEVGYAFDPATLEATAVSPGDMAFQHCLFLGDLAIRNFRTRISPVEVMPIDGEMVIRPLPSGPLIALFSDEAAVARTRQRILEASIGSGISMQQGPLGLELRVEKTMLPGRVATAMASHGGAVISIGGTPVDFAREWTEVPGEEDQSAVAEISTADVLRAPYGETGL